MSDNSLQGWMQAIEQIGAESAQRQNDRVQAMLDGYDEQVEKLRHLGPIELLDFYTHAASVGCADSREEAIWRKLADFAKTLLHAKLGV